MKKIFTLSLLILNGIYAFAQPNIGFENWHTELTALVPDNWQTFNVLSATTPPNPLSAFRVTGVDVHSGTYALQLKTVYFNNFHMPSEIGDTAGGAYTGHVTYTPFTLAYGFPYTSRPEFLEFWAKYIPVGNDTGAAVAFLSRWNGIKRDTIGVGVKILNYQPSYTFYKDTIVYISTEIPDSATIIFTPSKSQAFARVNSTLFVDDAVFTGWVGIKDHKDISDKVKIFPNPAKENLSIELDVKEMAQYIKIFDINGKLIQEVNLNFNNVSINTSQYSAGAYLFDIYSKDDKTIYQGKFSVIK